ncbi:MAG: hypothetical protein ABIO67_00290 [Mycobacteriales bacterium]
MSPTTTALSGVLILATSVWIGGLVAIAVVARVATRTLDPGARVAFFRDLGRTYGVVGTLALVVAYGTGAALLLGRPWDIRQTATVTVAASLIATTSFGVVQARRMSRLRRAALDQPTNEGLAHAVQRGAGRAGALRGLIALLSLALLWLGVLLAR